MRKRKAFATMLAVMAMSLMALNAHADTDGTELQVAKPSQLTIQLGPELGRCRVPAAHRCRGLPWHSSSGRVRRIEP